MIVPRNDNVVMIDVDETLIYWEKPIKGYTGTPIELDCQYGNMEVYPNYDLIKQIKRHYIRGHAVIVWSQGGAEWAEAVVKKLKLQKYVATVMCKPKWYIDDLDCSTWMGEHILPDGTRGWNNK